MRKSAFVPNKIPCDLLQQSWAYVQEPVAPLNTLHLRQASNLRAQEDDAANSGEGGCNPKQSSKEYQWYRVSCPYLDEH